MLHPSYNDLINAVNKTAETDEAVVKSRYSIVIAAAKRARQLIAGDEPLVYGAYGKKPLSIAIDEIYKNKISITGVSETEETRPEAEAASEEVSVSEEENVQTEGEQAE